MPMPTDARPGQNLPADFIRTIRQTFADGEQWLRDLPALLAACCTRFDVTLGDPLPLSFNYVTTATLNGAPGAADPAGRNQVVLKVGVPNPELLTEVKALQLYGGAGTVRLLDWDAALGALLLERLQPGLPLNSLPDDAHATDIAATLMACLWRPMPAAHGFHTVAGWGQKGLGALRRAFDGGTGPFAPGLVAIAEDAFAQAATSTDNWLLHGDLHHENVLSAQRAPWLVIDPKGVVGPRGYECGTYLRNHLLNKADPAAVLARRVDQLTEILGLPRTEILRWGVAHNVLSAWWGYEDDQAGTVSDMDGIVCAEFCAAHLRA